MALQILTVFSLMFVLSSQEVNAQPKLLYFFCEMKPDYTNISNYKTNLHTLLSSLPSSPGNGYGFYNLSYGEDPHKAHAVALCRGDTGHDECRTCLEDATTALPAACPNQREAIGWYDHCMVRYAERLLSGKTEPIRRFFLSTSRNLSSIVDRDDFQADLHSLLASLRDRAAGAGSLRKFASGKTRAPELMTIYALVQCVPDLSERDCRNCLDSLFEEIPEWFDEKSGGRVGKTSCLVRYETFQFFNDLPAAHNPVQAPSTTNVTSLGNNESNTLRFVVIVVVSISALVVSVVLIIYGCFYIRMKRRKQKMAGVSQKCGEDNYNESMESLRYSFETIRAATNEFSDANKLGEGGFGQVYKGILSDGEEIAVKRLSTGTGQGDLEFNNEVMLLFKLQHRNLVKLLGFCSEGSERILVYEFVPNASLDLFIFDPNKRENLTWDMRYKIIKGIARGLLYLHEDSRLRIIHRDLKSGNVLLDEEMNPKIADFGFARLFQVDQSQGITNGAKGTYGYMAPEYFLHGQFSAKSDVYSFGVLVLEIVRGQRNNDIWLCDHGENLLSYAWKNWKHGTAANVVDPLLEKNSGSEIMRCIHIALLCAQENVADRPTMNKIVLVLHSNSMSLPMPSKPASLLHSNRRTDLYSDSNSS